MTKDGFDTLVRSVREMWTKDEGCIVFLQRNVEGYDDLRLCCGGLRNNGFVVRRCVLWEMDNKLYEGDLDCAELKKILTKHKICFARYTTAAGISRHRQGVTQCLGCMETCKSKTCKIRGGRRFQITETLSAVL